MSSNIFIITKIIYHIGGVMRYLDNVDKKTICERMKSARTYKGMTQADVAKEMGVTLRTYQRIESMKGLLARDRLEKFCEVFDIPYNWLIHGGDIVDAKSMTVKDHQSTYNQTTENEINEISQILRRDKLLRKRILNFLRMHNNLSKFDEK